MGSPGAPVQVSHSTQIVIVRVQTVGSLLLCTFDFRSLELGCDRTDDVLGHLILELEDV